MDKAQAQSAKAASGGVSESKTKPWTVEQLEAPFVVCAVMLGLSLLVFGAEVALSVTNQNRTLLVKK